MIYRVDESVTPVAATAANERSPVLSPDESLKTFKPAPGFRIELVAAEPLIEMPVVIAFDADNPGSWAFHCHLLYHLDAGMFTTLRYV